MVLGLKEFSISVCKLAIAKQKCMFNDEEFQSMLWQPVEQSWNLFGEMRGWCSQGGLPGKDDASVASSTIGRRGWGRSQKNSNRRSIKKKPQGQK